MVFVVQECDAEPLRCVVIDGTRMGPGLIGAALDAELV
jgi:hypothetical protein